MSRSAPGAEVRARAARVIDQVLGGGRSLKAVLAHELPALDDGRDRALLESICFHALRWRRRYDHALAQWLARPLPAREAPIHALLLAGLAQLDAMKLPPHAALAATAEAARLLKRPAMVGLVNAILRRATREPLPASAHTGVATSHPDWLVQRLEADWGARSADILAANNIEAPMWLRINPTRCRTGDWMTRAQAIGLSARVADLPRGAVVLDTPVPPALLPGWDSGHVSIQDGAAQLAARALEPAPGLRVLDACAAPGGKTAQLLEAGAAVTAVEVDARRLRRVAATLERLGLGEQATLHAADAGEVDSWWDGRAFDAVLLDAPCSATGIIRRQPDIKWHRRPEDIDAVVAVQARLLDALWPTLRPGGRLLYATCSVLRAENALQVAAFLERTGDAHALPLPDTYGHGDGPGRQRLPGEDGMDGFFYALLEKLPA